MFAGDTPDNLIFLRTILSGPKSVRVNHIYRYVSSPPSSQPKQHAEVKSIACRPPPRSRLQCSQRSPPTHRSAQLVQRHTPAAAESESINHCVHKGERTSTPVYPTANAGASHRPVGPPRDRQAVSQQLMRGPGPETQPGW
jgi:hypothetical protein